MNIQKKLVTNTNNFRGGRSKRLEYPKAGVFKIVMHTYNGKGTSLFNWFQNNTNQVSSHYAVFKDGTVEQYVEEESKAYHAGQDWWNDVSIGIEHQDDGNPDDSVRTQALYNASAQLVADICRRHGIEPNPDNIVPHNRCTSTGCPGKLDVQFIISKAKTILSQPVEPAPIIETVATIPEVKVETSHNDVSLINTEINNTAKNRYATISFSQPTNLPINSTSMQTVLSGLTSVLGVAKDYASRKFIAAVAAVGAFDGGAYYLVTNNVVTDPIVQSVMAVAAAAVTVLVYWIYVEGNVTEKAVEKEVAA